MNTCHTCIALRQASKYNWLGDFFAIPVSGISRDDPPCLIFTQTCRPCIILTQSEEIDGRIMLFLLKCKGNPPGYAILMVCRCRVEGTATQNQRRLSMAITLQQTRRGGQEARQGRGAVYVRRTFITTPSTTAMCMQPWNITIARCRRFGKWRTSSTCRIVWGCRYGDRQLRTVVRAVLMSRRLNG
jgi:hypothetical protein